MGQGPTEEIDFSLFCVCWEREELSGFSFAIKISATMKSNERRP